MGAFREGERGQSEVLGTALLLGFVVIAAVAVVATGVMAFNSAQQQAEYQHIEQVMLDMRSESADVAIGSESPRSLHYDFPSGAEMEVVEDAGNMTITHHGYAGPESNASAELYHVSLGAVEVNHGDRIYALQGGGLFRSEGDFNTFVAPPTIAHRGLTMNILTLRVEGSGSAMDRVSPRIHPGEFQRPAFPKLTEEYEEIQLPKDNPVINGSVELVVETPYYEGWFKFFDQRMEGSATIDHDNQTASVRLDSLNELTVDSAAAISGEDCEPSPAGSIEGDCKTGEHLGDSEPLIEKHLQQLEGTNDNEDTCFSNATFDHSNCEPTAEGDVGEGDYYVDGDMVLEEDLEIDTSNGNVTIGIDGDLDLQNNEIRVTENESEYGVTYYVNGDLRVDGNAYIGTESEAAEAYRNVIFIADQLDHVSGTIQLDAIIYAPNADIEFSGNVEINGAIYAYDMDLDGNVDIIFDETIGDFSIDLTEGPTPIMYLHIVENTAVIDLD